MLARFCLVAISVALVSCGNGVLTLAPADASLGADDAAADVALDALLVVDAGADGGGIGSRGFPSREPWVSFYGNAAQMGDLSRAAATFRVLNIDADPDAANFSDAEISSLRANGQNRVISYLDVGSCESFRSYWKAAPGFKSCNDNIAAQLGPYAGYPDETWMNVGDADYQSLIVDYVAPRLASRGVDGFFLDNLEIVEHGTTTTNGPCDAACSQGGLDLVRKLREKFPSLLLVMQNATSDVTRLGHTGGVAFPSLLDGVSHEEVYKPAYDPTAETELAQWEGMTLRPGGRPFWVATEDYVGDCTNVAAAKAAYTASHTKGFAAYATDRSAGQKQVCYWSF